MALPGCLLCGEKVYAHPRTGLLLAGEHRFVPPAPVTADQRAARARIRSTWTVVVCRACRRVIGYQRRPTGALALVQAHQPHCPARTAHAAV